MECSPGFHNRFYPTILLNAVNPLGCDDVLPFVVRMAKIRIVPDGADIGQARLLLKSWPWVRVGVERSDDQQTTTHAGRVRGNQNLALNPLRPALDGQRS